MSALAGWLLDPLSHLAPLRPAASVVFALAEWSVRAVDVRPRRPVEIECLDGELLVTFEGDLEDHIVAAGEAFRARGRGRLVVAALVPSRVGIREAAAGPRRS